MTEAEQKQPSRLRQKYLHEIVPALQKKLGFSNPMQVPRLTKITLNMGLGKAMREKSVINAGLANMATIAGQKPVVTRARKSIAGFSIREGWPVGCMAVLRRERMYDFLDRLINVALPRLRDFRGLSARSFDGRGNYSLGIAEQIIFPEIDYDKIDQIRGLDVTLTTSTNSNQHAEALLRAFNFPFK